VRGGERESEGSEGKLEMGNERGVRWGVTGGVRAREVRSGKFHLAGSSFSAIFEVQAFCRKQQD